MGDRPFVKPLLTQNTTQKNEDTSMPQTGFEPVILVFERSKTLGALHR